MRGELEAILGISWNDGAAGGVYSSAVDAREISRQEKEYFEKRISKESRPVTVRSLTKEECLIYGIPWERIWQRQMEYVRENYGRIQNIEMAKKLNKTVPQVNYLLNKSGIRKKKSPRWSKCEEEVLSELWGRKNITSIAKSLKRTENAILVKAKKMRLGATRNAQGELTAKQLAGVLGIDDHVVYRWIKNHGLKCTQKITRTKFRFCLVEIDDFWNWAEKNQERFNSARMEQLILGKEPAWMTEKRKGDASRKWPRKWTPGEDNVLRQMFKTGRYTYQQIADYMGRTKAAVGHRLRKINVW